MKEWNYSNKAKIIFTNYYLQANRNKKKQQKLWEKWNVVNNLYNLNKKGKKKEIFLFPSFN